jgi:hypothetical protein
MCLWHGQTGSRGSADPLDACGVKYFVGIFDGQVRSSLPLAHPCSPAPPRPHTTLIAPTHRSRLQLPLCPGLFAWLSSSRRAGPPTPSSRAAARTRERVRRAPVCASAACARSASGEKPPHPRNGRKRARRPARRPRRRGGRPACMPEPPAPHRTGPPRPTHRAKPAHVRHHVALAFLDRYATVTWVYRGRRCSC